MKQDRLTESLVIRLLDWRIAPDRFIKPNGSWTPTWKFAPFRNTDQAFLLLEHAHGSCVLKSVGPEFHAEVSVGNSSGKATNESKAAAVTLALASALGLEVCDAY